MSRAWDILSTFLHYSSYCIVGNTFYQHSSRILPLAHCTACTVVKTLCQHSSKFLLVETISRVRDILSTFQHKSASCTVSSSGDIPASYLIYIVQWWRHSVLISAQFHLLYRIKCRRHSTECCSLYGDETLSKMFQNTVFFYFLLVLCTTMNHFQHTL